MKKSVLSAISIYIHVSVAVYIIMYGWQRNCGAVRCLDAIESVSFTARKILSARTNIQLTIRLDSQVTVIVRVYILVSSDVRATTWCFKRQDCKRGKQIHASKGKKKFFFVEITVLFCSCVIVRGCLCGRLFIVEIANCISYC